MTIKKLRVGIVGLQPHRSWAWRAHIPALRALADDFEIVGLANTSRASAEAAAAEAGIARAFDNVEQLVASPDVDVVNVSVKVPHHFAIVKAAIAAGKHIYCEWPLGNGLPEAEELARLARERGVIAVAGTQARVAPEIDYLRRLVADGYVGEVLSTTVSGRPGGWGAEALPLQAYLFDRRNGANMLTIPVGHTLAGLHEVLGAFAEVNAVLDARRKTVRIKEIDKVLDVTTPDQVLISGTLVSGAPISLHFRGGAPKGPGLTWEINGTAGDIVVTGDTGHLQFAKLAISGARAGDAALQPLTLPAGALADLPDGPTVRNVMRMYALMVQDIRERTSRAPSFDDAVALHRLIAAIERAAESGHRVRLQG